MLLVFYLFAVNLKMYKVESDRAVVFDVKVIVVVDIADVNGTFPATPYNVAVAELPAFQLIVGANVAHVAPNVTVNRVALAVAVVPVVNVTVKP